MRSRCAFYVEERSGIGTGLRVVSGLTLTLLLVSMVFVVYDMPVVVATGTIYIRADGSIDPPTAPTHQEEYTQFSEPPPTEWNKTYGGASFEHAHSVIQTDDGGYVLAGATLSYSTHMYDLWLVKTDLDGNKQWSKTYGGADTDGACSVVQTIDGGYAIAGTTWSFGAGYADFWLVKTDLYGNMQWNKTYGEADWDDAKSVVQTSDGGYALVGSTFSYGAGQSDFWLVKTDLYGNMLWNRTYGGAALDETNSVVQTDDGGYALVGRTFSYGAGYNFWLVKTDSNGNMQWNQIYGEAYDDVAYSVIQTSDGGYALAGDTWSYGAGADDFWLVKTNSSGHMQWNQTYGGADKDVAYSVIQTDDGGYALVGSTFSYGAGQSDFWLVKLAPEAAPPKITDIDPSQPIVHAYQYLTIFGEGFVSDSEVNVTDGFETYRIPKERTRFVDSNRIEVVAGLGYTELLWKVWVVNPGGIQSNKHNFQTRKASDENITKVLALALQYWTDEDAVIMTAIAGGESGWSPNSAGDLVEHWGEKWDKAKRYNPDINDLGVCSWGLWQILMPVHKSLLENLAQTDDLHEIAKWLRDPNNNVRAAYKVWKVQGFGAWSAYTQMQESSYYKNPWIWNRVINVARQMGIIVFQCPVNVTITDDYGRVLSEVENQIPGASFEYFEMTGSKVFFLPLNFTYNVQLNATDYGNCTITQMTPLESTYEIAFSRVTFNLTSETVAEFDLLPYDANYTLKVDENGDGEFDYELTPEIETMTTEYDVGITEMVLSKTIIGQGYSSPVNITVLNYGAHTETFNVTVYANTTIIETKTNITLTSANSTTITFTWNTTDFAKGNYTIWAYASPIPGETDTLDNTKTADNEVKIGVPGDLNNDNKCNILDLVKEAGKFGAEKGDPNSPPAPKYDPNYDFNDDNKINILDLVKLAGHFGTTDP